MEITVYVTDSCTLCDEAVDMILRSNCLTGNTLQTVDIVTDEDLLERYGNLIPVAVIGKKTLVWPFNEKEILDLVKREESS